MRIEPSVTVKHLEDAEPGELFRISLGGAPVLSLLTKFGEHRFLIVLETVEQDQRCPRYFGTSHYEGIPIISFGKKYFFAFDPADKTVELDGGKLAGKSGVLTMTPTDLFMRVDPSDASRGPMHYDIQTGLVVNASKTYSMRVFIPNWEVRLTRVDSTDCRRQTTLFSFTAT